MTSGALCASSVLTAALMSSIYEDHRDEDGFLYITYSGENTFGALDECLSAGEQRHGLVDP